jgi:energy-converting hydrogenase Eha subunit B
MNLLHPSKRTAQVLTYIGVFLCASMLVVGTLAAIFESAVVVRIYGALTAAAALIVGTVISRPVWPASAALPESSMPPNRTE